MFDMIVGECGHGVVAVVVVWLEADVDALDAGFLGCFLEVFGQ